MKPKTINAERNTRERKALRSRVKKFYRRFNKEEWRDCFDLIDPALTREGKVQLDTYADLMRSFKEAYGIVKPRWTHLSMHLDAASKKQERAFAYVYMIWQDQTHGFHMFRERWIKENGEWYTRVVGLVPNKAV